MLPHYDTYAAFIDLESALNYKRAEREALVDAAIAARRSTTADRPAAIANRPPSRLIDSMRAVRWMTRLARS